MTVPGLVQSALDGEEIVTRVSIGGDDELFVTPSSSIVYRAEGLLSTRRIKQFPHDADRITISEGRRKTSFTIEYSLDDPVEFAVPASKTEEVLQPILAGVLNGNGITSADETVAKIYRFSELTLILTSNRLVKHIGEAVWDEDYEEYQFDDVTNLSFEDGSVATQIVLEVDGRPQRIKAPNDAADDIRERLQRALFEYHDVESLAELNTVLGEEQEDDGDDGTVDFGDGVDPLDANPPEPDDEGGEAATASATSQSGAGEQVTDESGGADPRSNRSEAEATTLESQPLMDDLADESDPDPTADTSPAPSPEVLERLETLEAAVERQNERLEKQQQTIEQLITELRQGR
ncbi:hypothetical protein CV102_10395 [Natronococcus pandeyae]|uniref:DUF7115 domain-containing protein n=1 Tax=Natronococcus pandeyae TaxID=2055836 RepID=A0A8J8Q4Z8_9EURY|nr:hypothetical protein [Natronococcus pandeyae]TYL38907.1 hypothetical protein CV102_10395 [Natronococcus pandeyae]